jgi:hypothetical protein
VEEIQKKFISVL